MTVKTDKKQGISMCKPDHGWFKMKMRLKMKQNWSKADKPELKSESKTTL